MRLFLIFVAIASKSPAMKKKFPIISLIVILVAAALILYEPGIRQSLSPSEETAGKDSGISELFGKNVKASTVGAISPNEEFIKGMDSFVTFSYEENKDSGVSLRFSSAEKSFTAVCLNFNGSTHVAVEEEGGNRSLVFSEGRLQMPSKAGFDYPRVGFSDSEKPATSHMIGIHDFTDDGYPEFLIAVKDGSEGIAFFVLEYTLGAWKPIGEIVSQGKGLGGGRIFRQAFTLKNGSGTLFTWTCHGHSFDYLSSDPSIQETDLF